MFKRVLSRYYDQMVAPLEAWPESRAQIYLPGVHEALKVRRDLVLVSTTRSDPFCFGVFVDYINVNSVYL